MNIAINLWVDMHNGSHLVNRQVMHGFIHANMHRGKEKTPGCGARGTGPPPLTKISLVTRFALCLANTVAKAHLNKIYVFLSLKKK